MVLSDVAEVQYKCTAHHNSGAERSLLWNDPDIGVDWPFANPVLSDKDRMAPTLKEYLQQPAFGITARATQT
jgi:dTDP-4-dehydrorhamnose 3,5-epimerase